MDYPVFIYKKKKKDTKGFVLISISIVNILTMPVKNILGQKCHICREEIIPTI